MSGNEFSGRPSGSRGMLTMSDLRSKVRLIANTASECRYAPQLAGVAEAQTHHTEIRDCLSRGPAAAGWTTRAQGRIRKLQRSARSTTE